MGADSQPFELCGPLPEPGITVLEASAGTGKTFTIAALTTRLVADGVPIEKILAVTFTRMATAELRDRVRARLASAEELLGQVVELGVAPPEGDAVACHLAKGELEHVRDRRSRLAGALASFDAATITTTHGFCQLVLAGLGVGGGVGTGATLVESGRDVLDEVVDDLFLRGTLHFGGLDFSRQRAAKIAATALANPVTPIAEPDGPLERAAGDGPAGLERRLAEGVRKEVARRLLDANLLTYDDLLVRLRDALAEDGRGDQACEELRRCFQVVLVDEFQDTDPVQWEVVRRAFGDGATTLVLIGDPKQAIYAFRGADVHSYLEAARMADRRFTLSENWRSDEGLLEAYDALLYPLNVGHPEIAYRRVTATAAHRCAGLQGAPVNAPLRARVLHRGDHHFSTDGPVKKDPAVDLVCRDLAGDIVALLSSKAQLAGEPGGSGRRLSPGDIAVLVRSNRQTTLVQGALLELGVPAVVSGTESVLATPSARHWLTLLEALEQPASPTRTAAAALTPFVELTADDLAGAGDSTWEELHARLHRWADVLRRHGVASLARQVITGEGLPGRLLTRTGGERQLTDLAHVAQLLHAEGTAGQLGPPALRAWLARRIEDTTSKGAASDGADVEERSQRLDSDADAVQVLTVHRAKGLEFPIVYCPFLWEAAPPINNGTPVVFHDPGRADRRTLDLGGDDGTPETSEHLASAREDQRGEDLRLLYVALTRARHQAVIWWVAARRSGGSPLGRLLLARRDGADLAPDARFVPKDAEVHQHLEEMAARVPGRISVERCTGRAERRWPGRAAPAVELTTARFERHLDLAWRRASYTAITSGAHDEAVASEPEDAGTIDERHGGGGATDRPGAPADEERLRSVPSLMAELPGGAEVGTFVHRILERVDFAAEDLSSEVDRVVRAERHRAPEGLGHPEQTVAALVAAISTPLGPLASEARLSDVARGDRLDELGFELPLAGGERPTGEVEMEDLAGLVAAHTRADGPLRGYSSLLRRPVLAGHLRGYLTGSLDLVVRQVDREGTASFLVVDYKTNRLAGPSEDLSTWHYRPAALDAEMQQAHYPLQALLYMVALHRYLRWRLPGYRPEANLGGVLYLFVRGMVGPGTPVIDGHPCGVFQWRTPPDLVTGLSDLLETGSGEP